MERVSNFVPSNEVYTVFVEAHACQLLLLQLEGSVLAVPCTYLN